MEAKQKEQLVGDLLAKLTNSDEVARAVPVEKGDVFTFILDKDILKPQTSVINGTSVQWTGVVDKDGNVFSSKAITRRRNGLPLEGNTEGERMRSFFGLFDENDVLKVKVGGIRHREFSNTDEEGKESKSTANYFVFSILK